MQPIQEGGETLVRQDRRCQIHTFQSRQNPVQQHGGHAFFEDGLKLVTTKGREETQVREPWQALHLVAGHQASILAKARQETFSSRLTKARYLPKSRWALARATMSDRLR